MQKNSGLIQRCAECGIVIRVSAQYTAKKYVDDLRVKAVLDDGVNTYPVVMGADIVEKLTGINLEKAKQIVAEALDRRAFLQEIKNFVRIATTVYIYSLFPDETWVQMVG